jgi:hypothetical protein
MAAPLGARLLCRGGAQQARLQLVSEKTGKERVYRIVAGKAATKRKGKSDPKTA